MKFSGFFHLKETKFREVPSSIEQESERIADLYIDSCSKITKATIKQFKRIGLDKSWKDYFENEIIWFLAELTKTTFLDLKNKKDVTATVYVAYGEQGEDYASYDTSNNIFIIYDELCRGLDREKIVSTVVHELTHGFQEYKKFSDEYKKQLAKKTKTTAFYNAYYTQPIEFDAFTTEIGFSIRRKFNQLRSGIAEAKEEATKHVLQKRLEKFLLEFKQFFSSPIENYIVFKELPIPSILSTFEDLFETLKKNPDLLKLVRVKMFKLYEELTSSEKDQTLSQ